MPQFHRHSALQTLAYAAIVIATIIVAATYPIRSYAELDLAFFGGQGWTADSDVRLERPDGTDLTFHDVTWDTKPLQSPPYWGVRLTQSFTRLSDWDFALDFLHAKMYSDLEQRVLVSGLRADVPVDTLERIGDTFGTLEFTDGHNLLTTNALRKWQPFRSDDTFALPTSVYVGGGLGLAIPHSEVQILGSRTSEYQLAGPAAQFLAGARVPFGKRFFLKTEYRLTWAQLESDLRGGGRLVTESLTHHIDFGAGFRMGGSQ